MVERFDLPRLRADVAYAQEVFEALLDHYQHRVFQYCVTWLGTTEGEDVALEVFLTARRQLPTFRGEAPIESWLFGIARKQCSLAFRKRERRQRILSEFQEEIRRQAHGDPPETAETNLLTEEAIKHRERDLTRLQESLKRLPETDQLLIRWRYYQGRTIKEIAELVEKKEDTVRKRLLRSLQRLRQGMDDGPER